MNISILSNINMDFLVSRLSKQYPVYKPEGYGAWLQELVNFDSGLYQSKPQAVFIILDGEELVKSKEQIDEVDLELNNYCAYLHDVLNSHRDISFFMSNFDLPLRKIQSLSEPRMERLIENSWYQKLVELTRKYENLHILDLKNLVESLGRNEFYAMKMWYLGGMKFSLKASGAIEKEIHRCIHAVLGKRKKCIVLDLDNTLWGGVVGEVGIEGIELSEFKEGARYKDFQKRLKEIKNQGIILCVASKNNFEDAIEVIRNHKHMVLRQDDFAAMKINWENKAHNIREIAEELNIGLDSMVFIDDHPVEREAVRIELSQVTVPEFPEDTAELESFISGLNLEHFCALRTTQEDREKTEMYRQNLERSNAMKSSATHEDFLDSLETKITIWEAREEDVHRVSQLTQKTNQFNLTTKRYTESEIKNFLDSDQYDVFIASVEDKFGDNGKVAVVIVKRESESTAEIDTFLLSCRVMGRYVEDRIINFVENDLLRKDYCTLKTYYLPTAKNKPVEEFFDRLGYELLEKDASGNKTYKIDLRNIDTSKRKEFGEVIIL